MGKQFVVNFLCICYFENIHKTFLEAQIHLVTTYAFIRI